MVRGTRRRGGNVNWLACVAALLLTLLAMAWGPMRQGPAPEGSEFQVNSFTSYDQYNPSVAMDAKGNFVVAWNSNGQDGNGLGAFAQRFDPAGRPVGAEFRVSSHTISDQTGARVAMDPDGNFVIVWDDRSGLDGKWWGVFAQRYDSTGAELGGAFQVNSYTMSDQTMASVAMDPDGNSVVAWASSFQDGDSWGIFAQRFDSAGAPVGEEFAVNTFTTDAQTLPEVAMDANGDFVIVWMSNNQDGSNTGMFGRRFGSDGVPSGGEFQVNTYTTSSQYYGSVAMDPEGNFVVSWKSNGQDGYWHGVFARRYDSTGIPLGGEFQVNTYTMYGQEDPVVAMDNRGNFVVVWDGSGQGDLDGGVWARRYDSAGTALDEDFRVNTYSLIGQERPSVALHILGDVLVVVWDSRNQDGDANGVFGQRYGLLPFEIQIAAEAASDAAPNRAAPKDVPPEGVNGGRD